MSEVLKASKRTETGSRKARAMRKQGNVPAILYGHGQTPVALTLDQHELDLAILHHERILTLDIEGTTESALIKDLQWDTFGREILHVDLARVDLNERVPVTVALTLRGTAKGTNAGGVMQQAASEIEVECTANSIPEEIRISVDDLDINQSLHMSDVVLPEGVVLLSDPEAVVCSVTMLAEEVEAPEGEEAAAEPEVIGAKKEEESAE